MIRTFLLCLLPLCFLAAAPSRAELTAPDTLVKGVTAEVLSILHEDKAIQSGDRQRVIALIETKIAPHFDFPRMTRLALGRAGQQASAEQFTALTGEFRTLLVRTYANSLSAYQEQTVSFRPQGKQEESDEAVVRSLINKPGTRPIPLDYRLTLTEGGWKVFDVAVSDASLVTNYRSNFASEIEKGGIAGLLKALQDKNQLTAMAR